MLDGRAESWVGEGLGPAESAQHHRGEGPTGSARRSVLAACVADAFEAVHEAGLTHRDIKPSNIMVLPDGGAKVVDFGRPTL